MLHSSLKYISVIGCKCIRNSIEESLRVHQCLHQCTTKEHGTTIEYHMRDMSASHLSNVLSMFDCVILIKYVEIVND